MTDPGGTQPTLIRRLLLPRGEYRSGALRAMVRARWFIHLRWLAAMGGVVLGMFDVVLAGHPAGAESRPWHLLGIAAVIVALNMCYRVWSRDINRSLQQSGGVEDEALERSILFFTNVQMGTDLVLLTLVVRTLGGVISPIAVFYAFHIALAALLLTPTNALLQTLWALLMYCMVVFGECTGWIAHHITLVNAPAEMALVGSIQYVCVTYCAVSVGLLGIWYLVSRVGTALDNREQELRDATEALITSHQAIEELQSRRARFMLTAAHQLKSPVAGIQTLAGLINSGIIVGDKIQETCEKIIIRCKQAIDQVGELLALARLKDGGAERHLQAETDLVGTMHALITAHADVAHSKGIELRLNGPDGFAPAVRVDVRDLRDCLGNLIENAIKYSGDGKLVEVTLSRDDGGACVAVRDEGLGIDEETKAHMFDEFRRGNQALAQQISGSGLGLSIVREVLEHAGGRITVRSAPGEGSTFSVWLPMVGAGCSVPAGPNRSDPPPRPQDCQEIAYAGPNRREDSAPGAR